VSYKPRVALLLAIVGCGGTVTTTSTPKPVIGAREATATSTVNDSQDERTAALAVVQEIVDRRCRGCHDADHPLLELERRLTADDSRLRPMLAAVDEFRMPPSSAAALQSAAENTLESRYPMPLAERTRLTNHVRQLVDAAPKSAGRYELTADERFDVMRHIARQWIDPARIQALARPLLSNRGAFVYSGSGFPEEQVSELKLRFIALTICREVARLDSSVREPSRQRIW
jgi:hypothetical protein